MTNKTTKFQGLEKIIDIGPEQNQAKNDQSVEGNAADSEEVSLFDSEILESLETGEDDQTLSDAKELSITQEYELWNIVQDNALILATAELNLNAMKFFELSVGAIDTSHPPANRTVRMKKSTVFDFFGVKSSGKYTRLQKTVDELQNQVGFKIKDHEKGLNLSLKVYPTVGWEEYGDDVTLQFHEDVWPYLVNLKGQYTKYPTLYIQHMESKYGIVILKLVIMFYNQYERYRFTNQRTKEQLEALKNPIISMDQLRLATNTINRYERFSDFKKNVLDQFVSDANKNSPFKMKYDKIKSGRKITHIKFYVDAKETKMSGPSVDALIEDIYHKSEEAIEKAYQEAMSSRITKLLVGQELIQAADLIDQYFMATLNLLVYPVYQKMINLAGQNELEKHLKHMKFYKEKSELEENNDIKNLPKWLYTSAENYLPKLKTKMKNLKS
ncbi:RepB family plasmid replication initiator protein [Enterococcus faecium]|nr:RepB family plasmid replication initiator protein [Enterococcus faecium]